MSGAGNGQRLFELHASGVAGPPVAIRIARRPPNKVLFAAFGSLKFAKSEPFICRGVIPSMTQNKPKRAKNEVRDALLVSLTLAVVMFSLAMVASAHL